jgi:hypothetical protein
MSYDLAVFEPRGELRDRAAFLTWYEDRTGWNWGLDYSDPANATPALQAWYREMIKTFPPLNGPDRPKDIDLCTASFSIGLDIIYVAFSRAAGAYETMFRLAAKHGVGFFNASGNGEAWFPLSNEQLELVHQHQEGDPPGRMARMIAQVITRQGAVHANSVQDAVAKMIDMLKDPRGLKPIVVDGTPEGDDKAGLETILEFIGTIEPDARVAAGKAEWLHVIHAHPQLSPASANEGINPFTSKPMQSSPRPEEALVMIDVTEIGSIHWAVDDSRRLVVWSKTGAEKKVGGVAKDVAARLGWHFVRCNAAGG